MTLSLTRRSALTATAALPLAALTGTAMLTSPALADGHGATARTPVARSFKLGGMSVTTLLDGSFPRDGAKGLFGKDASDDEFQAVSAENFISPDKAQFYFTPTVVNTGSEVILFDTGLGQGGLATALAEVDLAPTDVDVVVLTHMHGDHIGGLMTDGAPTFPNARYVTGRAEYDGWQATGSNRTTDLMAKNVTPLADKMSFLEDGGSVASGVTAVAAFGHTPGHMTYMLESDGAQLVLAADLANHYVWSFARPDWGFTFDTDKAVASASRRRVLGMLAADRVPMIGYHMPFPGAGYVEARGDGFRFVPVGYQLNG